MVVSAVSRVDMQWVQLAFQSWGTVGVYPVCISASKRAGRGSVLYYISEWGVWDMLQGDWHKIPPDQGGNELRREQRGPAAGLLHRG